tara:strand:- start:220 stop:327 length:108 start_codon:yes stop_codon:yes gene_type:complete
MKRHKASSAMVGELYKIEFSDQLPVYFSEVVDIIK